jgi:hypothetical protein
MHMTAYAKAFGDALKARQSGLKDIVAERIKNSTPAQQREALVNAGVLTKGGRLAAPYRGKSRAA